MTRERPRNPETPEAILSRIETRRAQLRAEVRGMGASPNQTRLRAIHNESAALQTEEESALASHPLFKDIARELAARRLGKTRYKFSAAPHAENVARAVLRARQQGKTHSQSLAWSFMDAHSHTEDALINELQDRGLLDEIIQATKTRYRELNPRAPESSAPNPTNVTPSPATPTSPSTVTPPESVSPQPHTPTQGEQHEQPQGAGGMVQQPSVTDLLQAIKEKGNFGNITIIGDVGSKNTGGYSGAQPQAPANAPAAHGRTETAPGHGAHGHGPARNLEAAPQNNGNLWSQYSDLEQKQQVLQSELTRAPSDERANSIRGELARLREQQLTLCRAHIPHFDEIVAREVAKGGVERGQNASTATEARNALGAIQGRTRAEAARIIAEKTGGNPNSMRRWLSAFVRWPAAMASGMASGVVGYSFAQTGLAGGITTLATTLGVPAAWLGTLASVPATVAGVAVPFVGGLAIPAIPVVAAALIGVGVWQYVRPWLGFKTLDDKLDKGWQAKKLYNKMRVGDSAAEIDAKYTKISSRPTWRRMQTVPRIFGTLIGGMAVHDLATLNKGGTAEDLILRQKGREAYELGKKGATGLGEKVLEIWNSPKWSEWFKSGEPTVSGVTAPDCSAPIEKLRAELGLENERLKSDVSALAEIVNAPNRMPEQLAAANERFAAAQEEIARLKSQLAEAQAARAESLPPQTSTGARAPLEAPSTQGNQSIPRQGIDAVLPDKSTLEAMLHATSGKTGMWGASEEFWKKTGLSGPKLKWFTDLIEDYTQDGSAPPDYRQSSYFRKGLLEKITNGAANIQTGIPLGTPLHFEHLFGDPAIRDSILQRVSQSPYSQLSLAEKDKVMESIKQLFEGSQQLLNLRQR